METADYLPMFLAEGREHLQELNLAVVRIEEQPGDQATVDEIFRIAHSMKGMAATMGFEGMAALTHDMEDVFELLRRRTDGLGRDAVDVLLECLDALSEAVDAIEATGAEAIEPGPLAERLRGLVRDRTPEQDKERHGSAEPPANLSELAGGARVVHVSATLADDVQMPSVRAYMVLSILGEMGETVACSPSPDDVESFAGTQIDAWLVTDAEESALSTAAGAVADVDEAYAVQVSGEEGPVADPAVAAQAIREASPAVPSPQRGAARSKGAATVRVDAERLDQLMHAMGELMLHRTHLEALAAGADVPGLAQAMQDLTRALRPHRRSPDRPARARHPPPAPGGRRERPLRRRGPLRRPDRPDRRLRRHHPEPGRTRVVMDYTELQLDALRELANIGSGNASAALSALLGHPVDISVPSAQAVSFAEAVESTGDPETEVTGIVLGIVGDLEGVVLLLVSPADADALCTMLGAEPGSEYATSALGEVGNIVGSSYINALAEMTGMAIEPTPPATATDMLGAIVQTVLATQAHAGDVALMLDSDLRVEGEDCSIAFLLVPTESGVGELLERLGLG